MRSPQDEVGCTDPPQQDRETALASLCLSIGNEETTASAAGAGAAMPVQHNPLSQHLRNSPNVVTQEMHRNPSRTRAPPARPPARPPPKRCSHETSCFPVFPSLPCQPLPSSVRLGHTAQQVVGVAHFLFFLRSLFSDDNGNGHTGCGGEPAGCLSSPHEMNALPGFFHVSYIDSNSPVTGWSANRLGYPSLTPERRLCNPCASMRAMRD